MHLETNGSRPLGEMLELFSHVSLSPKQSLAETKLEKAHDLKLLYPWISEDITYEKFKEYKYESAYIQPVWDSNKRDALDFIYNNKNIKLSSQLHKYIEVL